MLRYLVIGLVIILVLGGAATVLLFGFRLATSAGLHSPLTSPATVNVTYRLGGTARRAVVTAGASDSQGNPLSVNVPWQTFIQESPGRTLLFSARNDTNAGILTCEIAIDGKVVETSTHSQVGGEVACMTRVP